MTLNTNVKFDKFIVRSSRCQGQIYQGHCSSSQWAWL